MYFQEKYRAEGLTRENGMMTMATNVAFPPYEYYENGEAVGIDVDVARAIADILNMELLVSDMEFDSIIVAAVLAFGLNSAAYVAEVVRAGIMSIEIGQFEAGRSLGLTYGQTMTSIIMPQAIKNSLPTMCNEFIALLKESSIVGYIGLMDLTKAGDVIRSSTYEAMLPLITVALVYLLIVVVLTSFVGKLERRLKKDAR